MKRLALAVTLAGIMLILNGCAVSVSPYPHIGAYYNYDPYPYSGFYGSYGFSPRFYGGGWGGYGWRGHGWQGHGWRGRGGWR